MAIVERGNRPLSPHMFIYRWPLNMWMSIFHRVGGVALGGSLLMVTCWFLGLAISPELFEFADWFVTSWFGIIILLLSLFTVWLHYVHGIRHLVWATGSSLGNRRVKRSAQTAIVAIVILMALTLWVGIRF